METNFNEKIVKSVAELLFYESSVKSNWLPIDVDYINKNKEVLSKVKLEDLIIYSLNNFPEIYNHRLLLCFTKDLINFNKNEWIEIIRKLDNNSSINSFLSFFQVFFDMNASVLNQYITNKCFLFYELNSYEIDEDDLTFIRKYSLDEYLEKLKVNLNKNIFPKEKDN